MSACHSTSPQTANVQMLAVAPQQHCVQTVCVFVWQLLLWLISDQELSSSLFCVAPGKPTAVSIQLHLCVDVLYNLTTNWLLRCYNNVMLLLPIPLRDNSHYSCDHIRLLVVKTEVVFSIWTNDPCCCFSVRTVNENCWQWCLNPREPMLHKQHNDC